MDDFCKLVGRDLVGLCVGWDRVYLKEGADGGNGTVWESRFSGLRRFAFDGY